MSLHVFVVCCWVYQNLYKIKINVHKITTVIIIFFDICLFMILLYITFQLGDNITVQTEECWYTTVKHINVIFLWSQSSFFLKFQGWFNLGMLPNTTFPHCCLTLFMPNFVHSVELCMRVVGWLGRSCHTFDNQCGNLVKHYQSPVVSDYFYTQVTYPACSDYFS